MVEFALVLPVVLLLLLGIVQFGIVFNDYIQVTSAAREGARKAAVSRTQSNPTSVAVQAAKDSAPSLDQSQMTVTVTADTDTTGWRQGGNVTVQVTYPWSVNLLGYVVLNGKTMTAQTTMRIE
jgi:Flp pilus assembly protein TadG